MSSRYAPKGTNRTPWMDEIKLIKVTETEDADGYITETETEREVTCTFIQGVTRSEFYEAYKAGLKLTASVELWEDDYEGEHLCSFSGTRYGVVRVFSTGRGTLELTLSEVVR